MKPLRTYMGLHMPGIEPPLNDAVPIVAMGAQQVKQLPLVLFGGDIAIPAGTDLAIDVFAAMGNRCTGFVVSSVVGTIRVSINGGSLRTIATDIAFTDCSISNLRVVSAAGSTCFVQLHGV